jgi:hypothetical protein
MDSKVRWLKDKGDQYTNVICCGGVVEVGWEEPFGQRAAYTALAAATPAPGVTLHA